MDWVYPGLVNNEWAIEQLQQFIASAQVQRYQSYDIVYAVQEEQIVAQAQVIEQIFTRVIPDWKDQILA